jgi:hypothetical protein
MVNVQNILTLLTCIFNVVIITELTIRSNELVDMETVYGCILPKLVNMSHDTSWFISLKL